jgi:hypothetical protein
MPWEQPLQPLRRWWIASGVFSDVSRLLLLTVSSQQVGKDGGIAGGFAARNTSALRFIGMILLTFILPWNEE